MMQHQFRGLRGKVYVEKYKRLYEELRPQLTEKFEQIKRDSGKFTPKHLGEIAIAFQLPVKVTSEYLEGYGLLSTGTWERLQARGCQAKDIGVVWD